MIICKKCGEAHYVKSGSMNGLQRYKCKEYGCNFTDTQAAGVPMKTKVEALRLYMEGLGLRAIGRLFGVIAMLVSSIGLGHFEKLQKNIMVYKIKSEQYGLWS